MGNYRKPTKRKAKSFIQRYREYPTKHGQKDSHNIRYLAHMVLSDIVLTADQEVIYKVVLYSVQNVKAIPSW